VSYYTKKIIKQIGYIDPDYMLTLAYDQLKKRHDKQARADPAYNVEEVDQSTELPPVFKEELEKKVNEIKENITIHIVNQKTKLVLFERELVYDVLR